MMSLNNEIIDLIEKDGRAIVGFADLRSLSHDARKGYDYGIIIALSFSKEAILENLNGYPQRYYDEHEPMDRRFKELKIIVTDYLISKGYDSTGNTPASVIDDDSLRSLLQQKTVATLAGIGWIGKTALLVTNEAGSAVRLTVILANAPVVCGTPVKESKCDPNCMVCTDICPAKAPKGRLWEAGVDRDVFFNAYACHTFGRTRARELLNVEQTVCGLCISSCPFTKKALGY